MSYQPKTGAKCSCKCGVQRDNCSSCEGTGWVIDFKKIRAKHLMVGDHNPNCDGAHCTSTSGEVRVLPSGGSNLILCRSCYMHEMHFRKDRNEYLSDIAQFPIPAWETLKPYTS